MRNIYRLIILSSISTATWASPAVVWTQTSQNSVSIRVSGVTNTSTCSLTVSESPTLSSPYPDTPYIVTNLDGTSTYIFGRNLESSGSVYALVPVTVYYYQFSGAGCGGTFPASVGSFTTAKMAQTSANYPQSADAARPWNWGYASLLALCGTSNWAIDPQTGLKVRPLGCPTDWTWRTGASPYQAPASTAGAAFACNQGAPSANTAGNGVATFTGGSGWSNAATICDQTSSFSAGSASTATTTNTNPIDLYGMYTRFQGGQAEDPWGGISTDDLGAVLYGGGNTTFTIQLLQAGTPACNAVTITAPSSFGHITGGSANDGDGAYPTNFPTPYFNGWGCTAPWGPEYGNTSGTVFVSGQTISFTTNRYAHFPATMTTSTKLYISNSSPGCANNVCTMATWVSPGQITTVETPSGTGLQSAAIYMWGVRVTKTGAGTLQVGVGFKHAGTFEVDLASAWEWAQVGNPHTFSTGDTPTHIGQLANFEVSLHNVGQTAQYFISSDGTSRPINAGINPRTASCFACTYGQCNSTDAINSSQFVIGVSGPDPYAAKNGWLYAADGRGGGKASLYSVDYTGDTTENLSFNFGLDQSGDGFVRNAPCDYLTITNYTAPSSAGGNNDIATQVATNFSSSYNSTVYGTFGQNNALQSGGCTGGTITNSVYCEFHYFYSGPGITQNYPGWIAVVNASSNPAVVTSLLNTGTGESSNPSNTNSLVYAGIHNITAIINVQNSIGVSTAAATANNPSVALGGPFQATVTDILGPGGSSYSSSIALPWPPDSSVYYTTCPGGYPANACVTAHIPVPCNIAPSALETGAPSLFPVCPWNAGYTQNVSPPQPGMHLYDAAHTGDDEPFSVISWNTSTNVVVLLRNASLNYCCMAFTGQNTGYTCNGGVYSHAANFTITMSAVQNDGCISAGGGFNPSTGLFGNRSNRTEYAGHGWTFPATPSGYSNTVVISQYPTTANLQYTGFLANASTPPAYYLKALGLPSFSGYQLTVGSLSIQTYNASNGSTGSTIDLNSFNGNNGSSGEIKGINICGSYSASLVGGTTSLYTIPVCWDGTAGTLTTTQYKTQYLTSTAGPYALVDASAPSSNIDSSSWDVCIAYLAGECHAGSSAMTAYANVPNADVGDGGCNAAINWVRTICVVGGYPGGGALRQDQDYHDDYYALANKNLGFAMSNPVGFYPYAGVFLLSDAKAMVVSPSQTEAWGSMARIVQIPSYVEDGNDRRALIQTPIKFPAGAGNYVRVRFGYQRFGSPTQFYCHTRKEACNTSTATAGGPFSFDSETQTATATSGGAVTVNVPLMPGNMAYLQPQVSSTGTSGWANYGDLQILPIN